ncbi:MAG: oxygen-independent coproporphyrinogen III oxidase [Lachnospiraceae bacterium]|nr:oxygen-independent coproporphyrinogen III oxidase [Lachnospiraceae bacterium]
MKNLELYIHIPFCIKKCDYCDFLSGEANEFEKREYIRALLNEIKYQAYDCKDYEVSTIYFGGGTPSILKAQVIDSILQEVYKYFHVKEEAEITIECNPGTIEKEKLALYKISGINRISLGLQSANNQELKVLGRIHNYEDFLRSYDAARRAGFENISVDLMSGLPIQTVASWEVTLKKVLQLKPEHISAYSLMIEKDTPFYDRYAEEDYQRSLGKKPQHLPSEDEERRMYKLTKKILEKQGYERYEISNYAKPGYECKHNVGYWRRENYIGMGIGASSLFENTRFHNTDIMFEYRKCNFEREDEEILGKKAQMEEFMFLGLRMTNGVSRTDFKEQFGMEIEGAYGPALAKLTAEGYLGKKEGRIFFTEAGIDVSNTLLTEFLL